MRRLRAWLAALAAAGTFTASSGEARAWYFPEHIVIGQDGVSELPRPIRGVLDDAIARARRDGLRVCASADTKLESVVQRKPLVTKMVQTDVSVECVPYAALPAIAGDHAVSAADLRAIVTGTRGLELTSAAAYEWGRFHQALEAGPNATIERMSYVHELDVDFYFLDPGYETRAGATRAHFVDASHTVAEIARHAADAGAIDNALGQFLAHHVRSLESAARGDSTDAILEHALAVHFLEDAFSAGHLVMTDETWRVGGNAGTRRRHDFFDARGLRVARALNASPCDALAASAAELTPCWTTTGDGWLGTSPDASDRLHAARAVAKTELALAIALDPDRVVAAVEALDERERIAVGALVDPLPWWTLPPDDRGRCSPSAVRGAKLVRGAASAVPALREAALVPAVVVGQLASPRLFDPAFVTDALEPCKPSEGDDGDGACGPSRALALGTVGASMVRPVLAEWPASEREPDTLAGESHIDHGFALQLLANANAGALFPPRAPIDFFAPAVGVSVGASYRSGTYLPGRRNRALGEINIGISEALHYDTRGQAGSNPHVTMLDQEIRWPGVYEVLTSYLLPLNLQKNHDEGTFIFLSGARIHEMLGSDPTLALWGVDVEIAAAALSNGKGAYPLYTVSPELRFYLGAADAGAADRSLPHRWGPTIGLVFTGGYANLL
ncbi:MAG TPA: hypothetical protein VIF62_12540 [Labilithrix sp.]|jgi:hypothetical protein